MKEFTQEEARQMAEQLEKLNETEDTKKDLVEKKEALQKLFTQALANYGVLLFNIKALKVEEEKQFSQINQLKSDLESLNKESNEEVK